MARKRKTPSQTKNNAPDQASTSQVKHSKKGLAPHRDAIRGKPEPQEEVRKSTNPLKGRGSPSTGHN